MEKSLKLKKFYGLTLFLFILFYFLWSKLPEKDAATYFNFADDRCLLGLNNFSDVMSNLAFALVGGIGYYWIKKNDSLPHAHQIIGYFIAFSIFLVSLGSAYFHYIPNVERLFWDRLPMVFVFISIVSILIADRVDIDLGYKLFFVLLFLASSVLVLWRLDLINLRPYLFIQFGCLIFVILMIIVLPKGQLGNAPLWIAFLLYAAAKVFEIYDVKIYEYTGFISGHTLKHLSAAVAMYEILSIFKKKKT